MAPRTLLWNVGVFWLAMGAIGIGFWSAGYPWVMFFCAGQAIAFAAAVLVHAVHACDGERVMLGADRVRVESTRGRHGQVVDFSTHWVRLDRSPTGGLTLRSGRSQMRIGTQLTEAERRVFAAEFGAGLASARRAGIHLQPVHGQPGGTPLAQRSEH